MKKKFILFAITFLYFSISGVVKTWSQIPGFEWVAPLLTTESSYYSNSMSSVSLNEPYIYAAGRFTGTVDFDPGPGTVSLTAVANSDPYIAKFDTMGVLIWVKHLVGTSGTNDGASITTDEAGNCYVTGRFQGTLDADPGPGTFSLVNPGLTSMYIIKLDALGNFVWAKVVSGTGVAVPGDISLDEEGNICLVGSFLNSIDFDPGAAAYLLTSQGGFDICLLKLSSTGDFLWVKTIGGTGADQPRGLTIDEEHGAWYITGSFSNSVDFDPGPGFMSISSNGMADIFILKVDVSGNFVWAKGIGGPLGDYGNSIRSNGDDLYITGSYWVQNADNEPYIDFDPGVDIFNLQGYGGNDMFVLSLNDIGGEEGVQLNWAKGIAGSGSDQGSALTYKDGKIYVTGSFQGSPSLDFDPGPGTFPLTTSGLFGDYDVSLLCLDSLGNFGWAAGWGGAGIDQSNAIAISQSGSIYTSGNFRETVDFDPGVAEQNLTTISPSGDAYLHKMRVCASYTNFMETTCDSFVFNGIAYTESGTYRDTFTNVTGCDSIVKLDLTIQGVSHYSLTTDTACDSYTFMGTTYTESGYYADTLLNSTGCDSIIALELTLGYSSENDVTLTACDAYTLGDSTYTISGDYTQVLTTVEGCDSTVHLDLNIVVSPTASVVVSGTGLIANTADSYQWLDCDNGYSAISGATGQSFNPEPISNYAVVITNAAGCSDTSACYTAGTTGISELGSGNAVRYYPNPTDGTLTIELHEAIQEGQLLITDVTGRVWYKAEQLNGRLFQIDMNYYAAGVYFISLQRGKDRIHSAITKQ